MDPNVVALVLGIAGILGTLTAAIAPGILSDKRESKAWLREQLASVYTDTLAIARSATAIALNRPFGRPTEDLHDPGVSMKQVSSRLAMYAPAEVQQAWNDMVSTLSLMVDESQTLDPSIEEYDNYASQLRVQGLKLDEVVRQSIMELAQTKLLPSLPKKRKGVPQPAQSFTTNEAFPKLSRPSSEDGSTE